MFKSLYHKENRYHLFIISILFVLLLPQLGYAAIPDDNLLNSIGDMYRDQSLWWYNTIRNHAIDLFWILAGIEFTWMGIQLALKGADLQEWAGELVKRILFIGFFLWLLLNSNNIARNIINSFRQAANDAVVASGGIGNINPSSVFDSGLLLANKVAESVSFWSPGDSIGLLLSAMLIFICFALIAAFLLLAIVEMFIAISAGVIFLGFGGSLFTKEYAVKYLVYCVSLGAKLFVMQLIVGIGQAFVNNWTLTFNEEANSQILVLIGAAIVLLALVKEIPNIVAGLIQGANFSAGDSIVSTGRAVAGAAATGVIATGGGAAAVKAAANLANEQGYHGAGGMVRGTAVNLARAAKDDIAGKFAGHLENQHGTMGARMADKMTRETEAHKESNSIGKGKSSKPSNQQPPRTED